MPKHGQNKCPELLAKFDYYYVLLCQKHEGHERACQEDVSPTTTTIATTKLLLVLLLLLNYYCYYYYIPTTEKPKK
jgi:hypothetical protein